MEFMAGQAVAYLKIISLALVIMAGVWGVARISTAFYNRAQPSGDGDDKD